MISHRLQGLTTMALALVLFVPAATAAAGSAAPVAKAPTRGGTLRVGIPEQFKGFDPFALIGRRDYQALQNICDTLFTYGPNYAPTGLLVDRWSSAGTRWTLHLRRDVKFTDGTPLDASAVKFSLVQVKRGPFGSQIAAITRIDTPNPLTVRITLNKPLPALPAILTQQQTSIVSASAYRKEGSKGFARKPVCSGPFMVASWNGTGDLTLKRNPNYWRKDAAGQRLPYLDGIVFKTLPDPQAEVAALQAGDVDMIYSVPAPLVPTLEKPPTRVAVRAGLGWVYFFLNTQSALLTNVHLRRAIELAVDRNAIVAAAASGLGAPALGPINTTSWAYDPSIKKNGFYRATANLAKARQELAAGGEPKGFKFTLEYPTEDPFNTGAQIVKSQLAAIGIDVNLLGKDIGAVLDDLFATKFDGGLMIDFSGRIDPELGMAAFYRTKDANNFSQYSNPQVDQLLNTAARITSQKRRAALYQRVQTIVNEDAPIILLYFPDDVKGLRSNVRGFVDLGDERPQLATVWLSK
jgi:peptide/nickel transport system substrate-binding protein